MDTDTDVLIVGAGPVGLTMASFLSFHGIPFRIIDKNSHGTQTSNAIAVQSRTLELLKILGVDNKLIAQGNKLKQFHIISNKITLASWDLNLIDSIFPYLLTVSQNKTEQVLIDYLDSAKIKIERETELLSTKETSEYIDVKLKTHHGEQSLRVKYLIACDGYKSAVRGLLSIPYEGEDMLLDMIILDAPIDGLPEKKDHGYTAFSDTLSVILLPLEKSWRIIADVSHEPKFHCGHGQIPTESTFQEILDKTLKPTLSVGKGIWASKFMIHERLAKYYQRGRIFLVGDAAHAHSPAGGQGMNTGMQDAVNLAWKLALVIKGKAKSTLLNTYEEERRPVAEEIIQFSGFLIRFATIRNKVLIKIRDFMAQFLSKLSFVQKKFAATLSEINVTYAENSIVQGKKSGEVIPGGRISKRTFESNKILSKPVISSIGKKYILLDFYQDKPDLTNDYPEVLSIQKVPRSAKALIESYGMGQGGYVLIRPDQFIGFIGHDKVLLQKHLKQHFI